MRYRNSSSSASGWGVATVLTFIGLWLTILVGWIMNIVALAQTEGPILDNAIGILRVVGIVVPPLGAVMGFFVN